MATKQEWDTYIEELKQYIKDLKKWVKKLPADGDVSTQSSGIETPPPPPKNP
jgi:hypothetical protein